MAQTVTFMLTSSSAAVTGAVNADFTKVLYRDGGSTSEIVVVTELANGAYKATYTAVSVDKYHLFVSHANDINGSAAGVTFDWDLDVVGQIEDVCIFHPSAPTILDGSALDADELSFPLCFPQIPGFAGLIPEGEFALTGIVSSTIIRGTTEIDLADGGDLTYTFGALMWMPTTEQVALMLPGDIIALSASVSCTHNGVISRSPPITLFNLITREENIEKSGILGSKYALTIPVVDGSANPVTGALLQIRDTSDNKKTQGVTRSADGKKVFLSDDGTFRVYPSKTGYSYAASLGYVEVTVDGADITASNIVLAEIATSAPADPSKCNVYLNLQDAGSADTNAVITMELFDRPNGIGTEDDQPILTSSGTETFVHQGSGEYIAEVNRNATYKIKGVDPKLTERNSIVTVANWGQARIYFNTANKEVVIKEIT